MKIKLLLIGAGSMGTAIIKSFIESGGNPEDISVLDPYINETNKNILSGCSIYNSQADIPEQSSFDAILLAVKPQTFNEISQDISVFSSAKCCVISIMAGVETKRIASSLGIEIPVIRCMPNIAALVKRSVNVAYIENDSYDQQKAIFEDLFRGSGPIRWVDDEDLIHKTTALSGSGPAYFFAFVEAIAKAGIKAGLSEEHAMNLSIDTLIGAAALIETDRSPKKLRDSVTSKGGTTAAALSVFMDNKSLDDLVSDALSAAEKRSREL